MGFAPDQVDQWAPYQVMAVYQSWIKSNTPQEIKAPTPERFREVMARSIH